MSQTIYKATPRKAREWAIDALEAGLVPFIKSSPGAGKSSILKSIARDAKLKMIDHRVSTSQPEDFTGLPDFDREAIAIGKPIQATFRPFDIFPIEGTPVPADHQGWMLFLDEFNSGLREVQAAAYKLALDKMVGQHRLHTDCHIAMAGNLNTDGAIVNQIGTAMQSRLVNIIMEVSFKEWLEDVALPEGYDERVRGYLSWKGLNSLMKFDARHKEENFPCPRTWEFVNRMIKGKTYTEVVNATTNEAEHQMDGKIGLFAGTIGESEAVSFVQYCKVTKDIVTIREILADPHNAKVHHTAELKYAQITHVVDKVDAQNFADIAIYVARMDISFVVLFYRSLMKLRPELKSHPTFAKTVLELARHLA